MQSLTELRSHTNTANLTALQRIDNTIHTIIYTVKHVVLYKFDTNTQQWQKHNTEGVLFITQHSNNTYSLIILNRKSIQNYSIVISRTVQVELNEQYIFYMVNTDDIFNLWIYNTHDAKNLYNVLRQIVDTGIVTSIPQQLDSTVQTTPSNDQPIQSIQPTPQTTKQTKQQSIKQSVKQSIQPTKPLTQSQINAVLSNKVIDTNNKADERQLHMQLDSFLKKLDAVDTPDVLSQHTTNGHTSTVQPTTCTQQPIKPAPQINDISVLLTQMNIKHKIDTPVTIQQTNQPTQTNTFKFEQFAQSLQTTKLQFKQQLLNLINDDTWLTQKYKQYQDNNNNINALFT